MDAKLLSCGVFLYPRCVLQGGHRRLLLPGAMSHAVDQDKNETAEKDTQKLITCKCQHFPEITIVSKTLSSLYNNIPTAFSLLIMF